MGTVIDPGLRMVGEDLGRIFGDRLEAFVAYGSPEPAQSSLALVRTLTIEDLAACAARSGAWRREGAATPLVVPRAEFARALDAFPVEFGEIMATHRVLAGTDPFAGLSIRPADLRRACEVQARSLLLHLREDFIDCAGRPARVAALVEESASAFAAVLRNLARLDGGGGSGPLSPEAAAERHGIDRRVAGDVMMLAGSGGHGAVDGARLFPEYLRAVEQLVAVVDQWSVA
ncbi:MAG: hypothetical protein AB1635_19655 [Acidobacteriota bacterium]